MSLRFTRPIPTDKSLVLYQDHIKGDGEIPERVTNAIADLEHLIYEAWAYDNTLTKDAARRFLQIAAIFEWDMPWVDEMREWM